MAYEKKTWRTDLAGVPVNWGCFNPETLHPNASDLNGSWARMVVLTTIAPDGRRLEMVLTPALAREYGRQIVDTADTMDAANRRHGDGFAPDYEEPVAVRGRPSFEQLMDTAHRPPSDPRLMGQQEVAAFLEVAYDTWLCYRRGDAPTYPVASEHTTAQAAYTEAERMNSCMGDCQHPSDCRLPRCTC